MYSYFFGIGQHRGVGIGLLSALLVGGEQGLKRERPKETVYSFSWWVPSEIPACVSVSRPCVVCVSALAGTGLDFPSAPHSHQGWEQCLGGTDLSCLRSRSWCASWEHFLNCCLGAQGYSGLPLLLRSGHSRADCYSEPEQGGLTSSP